MDNISHLVTCCDQTQLLKTFDSPGTLHPKTLLFPSVISTPPQRIMHIMAFNIPDHYDKYTKEAIDFDLVSVPIPMNTSLSPH
jgi:hypothetical protein